MKRAVLVLGTALMAALCLIAKDAGKDTILQQKTRDFASAGQTQEAVRTDTLEEVQQPESNEYLLLDQNKYYAFSMLDQTQQRLYVDILSSLVTFQKETSLNTVDPACIDKVFCCVLLDHPEIFYVDGYRYTEYTEGDEVKRITFSGNYLYSEQEAAQRKEKIRVCMDEILSGISADAPDYDKVKYIYETLITRTQYDASSPDNQNICSVFLEGKSVCQGYAKATQYLLQELGIPCVIVTGTVKDGEGHAWDLALLDGSWYYVDTTWGDAYYQLNGDKIPIAEGNVPSANYDYLCVTTDQLERTHKIDNVVPVPECTSMEANYYVREGAYFVSYDEEKIKDLINRAKTQEKETVTIKCADDAVYQEIYHNLITQQKIFLFLDEVKGSIAYTNSEELRSISFWM